ncbi:hypothetical protein [Acidithiobacillus ferridurans]|uniref:Uncharacterized protein n=1 Tax=Acidithiobacillus ferridurans TaxID=1232575 RepID=A0A8X8GDP3_ACIFI|nr:hypothetical protein [Acidithiobacillus ferridurans]MBU2715597.1 hypothetical protein [Acidithiobacillus ferridurans]MBU2722913.1 hypothetical protein [Acidithiobacillus ferridurans]MBU2728195.1 hypothetical protein [Acidithiobacillus ferridurans]
MSSQQMVAILCSETPEQHEACRILENGDKEVVIAFWCFDAGEKYRNDRYSIVFNTPERGQYPGVARAGRTWLALRKALAFRPLMAQKPSAVLSPL